MSDAIGENWRQDLVNKAMLTSRWPKSTGCFVLDCSQDYHHWQERPQGWYWLLNQLWKKQGCSPQGLDPVRDWRTPYPKAGNRCWHPDMPFDHHNLINRSCIDLFQKVINLSFIDEKKKDDRSIHQFNHFDHTFYNKCSIPFCITVSDVHVNGICWRTKKT
jgi:hypothetical protein